MTTPTPAPLDKLKAQLAQLEQLVAEGVLTGDAARKSRDDLEAQILQLVLGKTPPAAAAAADAVEPAVRLPRSLVLGIAAFVLVFGAAGYGFMGNKPGWQVGPGDRSEAAAAANASPEEQKAQVLAMVAQIEERLKTRPDDAEGWQMLARSYGVMGRYAEALTAQKRVVELKPQDAQALADLADTTAMAGNRTLDGEPERLIMQAMKLDPRNIKALALAGTVAYNKEDFKGAVAYWEQAVALSAPGSGYVQQLTGALEEARQRGGLAAAGNATAAAGATAAPAAPGAKPEAAAASIQGRVTLRAGLQGISPDDTVFIFARAPEGSRMPLAILKRKVSDLPLDFTLDDSLAMSPAARLSSVQQVVVGARISKSGNAIPGPGDLQAMSAPVAVTASGLTLEIGDPVK